MRARTTRYDLVSCSPNELKVWRAGRCVRLVTEPRKCLSCIGILSFTEVAIGHHTGKIVLYDAMKGSERRSLEGHSKPILALSRLNPNRLVSGCWDKTLKLWDLSDGRCLRTYHGHTSSVQCIARLSSTTLLSGSCDGDVALWDTGRSGSVLSLKAHTHYVLSLALLSSKYLCSASFQEIKVWDLRKIGKGDSIEHTPGCVNSLIGHKGWIYSLLGANAEVEQMRAAGDTGPATSGFNAGPDELRVLSGGGDGTVRIWDAVGGRTVHTLSCGEGDIKGLAIVGHKTRPSSPCPSGPVVAVAVGETINLWSFNDASALESANVLSHSSDIHALRSFRDPLCKPTDVSVGLASPAPSHPAPHIPSVPAPASPPHSKPSSLDSKDRDRDRKGERGLPAAFRDVLSKAKAQGRTRSHSKGGAMTEVVPRKKQPRTPMAMATMGSPAAKAKGGPPVVAKVMGKTTKSKKSGVFAKVGKKGEMAGLSERDFYATLNPAKMKSGQAKRKKVGKKGRETRRAATPPHSLQSAKSSAAKAEAAKIAKKKKKDKRRKHGKHGHGHGHVPATSPPLSALAARNRSSKKNGRLAEDIGAFQLKHEHLARNDMAILTSLFAARVHRLRPETYERKFDQLGSRIQRLLGLSTLEGQDDEVRELEKKYGGLRERMMRQVEMLRSDPFFELVDQLIEIKNLRAASVRLSEDRLRHVDGELKRQMSLKKFLRISAAIGIHMATLQKALGETTSVRKMMQHKLNDSFIEKKKSLENELTHYEELLAVRADADEKVVVLLEERRRTLHEFPEFRSRLPDHDSQKSEMNAEFSRHDQFFRAMKSIHGELKALIDNVPFRTMKSHYDDLLKKQETRDQLTAVVENDFRSVNLKNNRDIDKLSHISKSIREGIDELLHHIMRHCHLFERKIPVILNVKVARDSLKKLEEEIITEVVNVQDVLHEMKKHLEGLKEANEVIWGKMYSGDGRLFRRKKLIYFGQLKDGKQHGYGKEFHDDAQTVKFYGRYRNGKRHGGGEEYDIEGIVLSRGEWSDDSAQVKVYDLKRMMDDVNPVSDLLGKGSFGEVYRVQLEGETVAMKRIFLSKDNVKEIERFRNEVSLLSRLKHPHVIKIIGWSEYEDDENVQFGLITEFCPTKIQSLYGTGKLTFREKVRILTELAQGMAFLHSREVIHRDLKFENVLLGKDGAVKLIDFGLSKQIESFRLTQKMTAVAIGTPGYVAPEVLDNANYTYKCDLFSFGIMMHAILCETDDPYDTAAKCAKDGFYSFKLPRLIVDEDLRPEIPEVFRKNSDLDWFIRIMRRCWEAKPEFRPDSSEVADLLKTKYDQLKKQTKPTSVPAHPGRPMPKLPPMAMGMTPQKEPGVPVAVAAVAAAQQRPRAGSRSRDRDRKPGISARAVKKPPPPPKLRSPGSGGGESSGGSSGGRSGSGGGRPVGQRGPSHSHGRGSGGGTPVGGPRGVGRSPGVGGTRRVGGRGRGGRGGTRGGTRGGHRRPAPPGGRGTHRRKKES